MADIVLHPATAAAIDTFLGRPSHALLLVGPAGIGKGSLSRLVAIRLLKLSQEEFEKYPYLYTAAPVDGKAISIETIRQLQEFMTLKVPGSTQRTNRIAIIEAAHFMTTEAQNALLKTLEEPPENTVIILTAVSAQTLLPTVLSRVRLVLISPPAEQALVDHFSSQNYSSAAASRALTLSGGLPGLTHALLTYPGDHPLYQATEQARLLLGGSVYDRLTMVDSLAKDRQLCRDTLFILGQMAHLSLQKAETMPPKTQSRWQSILKQAYLAQERLRTNANSKLVMTDLMLNL